MGFTEVFGGSSIFPSDVSYLALALTGNIDFEWPVESAAPPYPLARIIDVMTNGAHTMRLPDATMAAPGETALFNCLTASAATCFLVDHDGVNVGVLAPGEQWEIYLTDNTTAGGQWEIFRFGASTATVQPSALAGYGIVVTGSTLSQAAPVTTFDSSPRSVYAHDRASVMVWTGSGSGTLDLPPASAVGNNYFVSARNAGGGMLNLDPNGSERIDGLATVALSPGEGVVLITDGIVWFTLGRGQAAIFAFDHTGIELTGKPSPYVLSGSELNRVSYKFFGELTHDEVVSVPPTVQQYWVDNSTTGSFTLALSTVGGTPVTVVQGSRGIYYCNGTDIVDADTSTGFATPINASDGGTGHESYATGDMLTASGATTLARLAAVPIGNALIAKGAGVMPAWGKIDLSTMVEGTLPPGNGGTGGGSLFLNTAHVKADVNGNLVSSPLMFDSGASTAIYGDISTGPIGGSGPHILELGALRTSDGDSLIDFHSVTGTDNEARIIRIAGPNGNFEISNIGSGLLRFTSNLIGETLRLQPDGVVHANGWISTFTGLDGPALQLSAGGVTSGLIYTSNPGTVTIGVNRNVPGAEHYFNFDANGQAYADGAIFWNANNDGHGSGLDADTLDGYHASDFAGAIGFTPIQQGGGPNQGGNKINIGWQPDGSGLRASVDNADLGRFAFNESGGNTWRGGQIAPYLRSTSDLQADANASIGGALTVGAGITGYGHSIVSGNSSAAGFGVMSGASTIGYMYSDNTNFPGCIILSVNRASPGAERYFVFNPNGNIHLSSGELFWNSFNDGAGSGLDADLLDGNQGSFYANIPERLGFWPVRQGGGVGQGTNTVYIGWSASGLLCTVDSTDQGLFAFNTTAGNTWQGPQVAPYIHSTGSLDVNGSAGIAGNLAVGGTITSTNGEITVAHAGNCTINLNSAGVAHSNFTQQADGNLVLYRFDGSTSSAIWSVASNVGPFQVNVPINCNSNVSAYSDRKLKTNLEPIPDALAKVSALTGYTFDRIDVEGRQTGLIAQEVQEVLPEAVTDHDGTLALAYGNMAGLFVEAIKALQGEVQDLRARLEAAGL